MIVSAAVWIIAFCIIFRCPLRKPEIALEVSTSGKYIARKLRDMGFLVHLADPSNLSLIFMTAKKNDKEDSYKPAKLLRLKGLPEVDILFYEKSCICVRLNLMLIQVTRKTARYLVM